MKMPILSALLLFLPSHALFGLQELAEDNSLQKEFTQHRAHDERRSDRQEYPGLMRNQKRQRVHFVIKQDQADQQANSQLEQQVEQLKNQIEKADDYKDMLEDRLDNLEYQMEDDEDNNS